MRWGLLLAHVLSGTCLMLSGAAVFLVSLPPLMEVKLAGHYSVRRLVLTSLPPIAMMIITSVYSIVDGYFVSNFAGSTEFAALNIVWPALALVSAVGLMVGTGGSALVSKTFGEGDPQKACAIFTRLVKLCLEVGVVVTVLLFIFMKPVAEALGAEGEMVPLAVSYGRIVVLSMPLFILSMAFQSFYMTAERPELGTRMSILCGVLNIVLDAVFIIGFGWGLVGAALGTTIALAAGGLYPLFFFLSKCNRTQLKFVKVKGHDWMSILKSCTNGMSEYVGNVALNVVSIGYNLQLMKYIGEDGVSAYGIIMYIGFVFGAVFIGYNLCVSQVIAYNFGAGNRKELRSLFRKSMLLIAAGGVIMTALAEIGAPALSRIFVGYDADLTALTQHALRIYMLSFLLCGFNMFCSAWFTALNNGLVSALAAFVRTLVFEMATVIILPSLVGIDGIWSAVCVAEVLAFIMSSSLFAVFRKRYLAGGAAAV